jgi:phosphoserine phosphatase
MIMRHVITLIARAPNLIQPEAFVTQLDGVTGWQWLDTPIACDIFFDTAQSESQRKTLEFICATARIDMIAQPVEAREKRLLISDMDSTMIEQECIDELADKVGLKSHVAAITERAMNGELDFAAALRERVMLLKGLPEATLQAVFDHHITFMSGAKTLVQTMRARGAHCVLVSGGFQFFTQRVADVLGFHAQEANQLEIVDGVLTGRVIEPILDKQSKLDALNRVARECNLSITETLAVGDGANDLPMLQTAGLGVAYHAKTSVQKQAAARVNFTDLTTLLYAQGITKSEWVA